MKTRRISAILACIMLVSLTACANERPGKTPDESTAQATEAQTTENVTTEETTEETTETAPLLAFNEDLLSDIGSTYPQLLEKRGQRVDVAGFGGGVGYYFENGYGAYIWGFENLDYGRELEPGEGYPLPRDENGKIVNDDSFPLPHSDICCNDIIFVQAKDLFVNMTFPINTSNIKGIEGVENLCTGEDGIASSFNYATSFIFNERSIHIYHNDRETVEADSQVDIWLVFNNDSQN